MSTKSKPKKNDRSQHAKTDAAKKQGTGSRLVEEAEMASRGRKLPQDTGNDPQKFSKKIDETGRSAKMGRSKKSENVDDEEE